MDSQGASHDVTTVRSNDAVERYGTYIPPFVRLSPAPDQQRQPSDEFRLDADRIWRRGSDTALGQAVVTIGGALQYDLALENNARVGDAYQFRSSFKHLKETLDASDLTIASFTSVVDDTYPSLALARGAVEAGQYANARSEYLEAIAYAGVDCIAAAHPRNLTLGVEGIVATEASAQERGLVVAGLGERRTPVFDLNGIAVAVLSYTLDMRDRESRITHEGAAALLSEFAPDRIVADIEEVKSRGAEFIIGMLNCQGIEAPYGAGARRDAGIAMAECGVDFVVCNRPGTISKYLRRRTQDGREVSIATSLGTLISGVTRPTGHASALLRLTLRVAPGGRVEVEDSYIPVLRPPYHAGAFTPAIPLPAGSRMHREHERAPATVEQVAELLGEGIRYHEQRRVVPGSHLQPHFTPNDLARILGTTFSAPDEAALGTSLDQPLSRLAIRVDHLNKGCAAVVGARMRGVPPLKRVAPAAAKEAGARIAIASEPIEGIPTLVVEDTWMAARAAGHAILDRIEPTVIAVTGTAGKTTTKDLVGIALSAGMQTLHVKGNGNTPGTAFLAVQTLRPNDEAFVQEVHEGTPGAAELISDLLRPRIAVITSIADGHLDQMGTIERVIEGNTDIVKGMPGDGVLIVNNDNEYLRELTFRVRTLRYGIEDPTCDVYARDVQLGETQSTFTIVDGSRELGARLEVAGAHNVGNALAAYLAAREAGVAPHRIIGALSTFRSSSVRQNLVEHGGYHLLVDTYNSNLLALAASLDMLSRIELEPGARRIAVLGDMGEQGDKVEENHAEAGRKVAGFGVDILLCHGDGVRHAAAAAHAAGVDVIHEETIDRFLATIRDTLRPGDVVLFKAAGAASFTERVVRPLFGNII